MFIFESLYHKIITRFLQIFICSFKPALNERYASSEKGADARARQTNVCEYVQN